ncbi:MAG: hypothetical protein ACRD19_17295, partial [Terriglobia bacterium]
ASGRTVWLQTVEGTSRRHTGNAFTHGHNVKMMIMDSVKDAAEHSAASMEAAPELRKLAMSSAATGK